MNRQNLFGFLWMLMLVCLPVSAQEYRNPVIPGYHPDPSVCRVGDTFYLVNSSFQYFPGVPLFQSKDLVHWQQIGNVLDRESQLPLKGASSWLGIYAPTIRYHEGIYYMITTNVGNGGNFMVTAKDPRGPWSEPIWLKQQGIDPSLYFENGKCYMVSNPDDAIWLCEINPETGEQLTESKKLWQGDGGRYPEGPHIYKKDGYYYLLISEGGTELAHHLTIARSKNIEGPYESNPNNPILTNCSRLGQSLQIQGTGHGDFVQAENGSWWMVFLAYRNYGGSYHHLGRETYLAPVEWKAGEWPVVNGGLPIDTLVKANTLPSVLLEKHLGADEIVNPNTGDAEWIRIQNPIIANYDSLATEEGFSLRLYPHGTLTANNQPTFFGRRQESANFELQSEVFPKGNVEAGLTVYQINDGHLDFFVTDKQIALRCKLKSIDYIVKSVPNVRKKAVKLRVRSEGIMYYFDYSTDGKTFKELASMNCSLMSTEVAGGFTGVTLGMYVDGKENSGSADFSYFHYEEK
ncbi:glycoside hydrolase family 43 protein [uncultured Prevotella sp.]|uniref:glycoside hydrolase family 43 protein n=1 Tax=Segatella hominis TaxID=2518605 RepID=UPI002672AE3F|nr:glycoside hydrolase family 43 protein [uncultured Prevotella sp.]